MSLSERPRAPHRVAREEKFVQLMGELPPATNSLLISMNPVRRYELLHCLEQEIGVGPDALVKDKSKRANFLDAFSAVVSKQYQKQAEQSKEWRRSREVKGLTKPGDGWLPLLLTALTFLAMLAFSYVLAHVEDYPRVQTGLSWMLSFFEPSAAWHGSASGGMDDEY